MNGEAIKELASRLQVPAFLGDGVAAAPPGWSMQDARALVKPGPQAETLKVYTLGALRGYLRDNRDGLDLAKVVVHVVSPQIVTLRSTLDTRARSRETFLQAAAADLTDNFLGKFMPIEEFLVGLHSRFLLTDERQMVLRLFGSVKQEAVKTALDDGVSQTVTARSGVALVSDVQVPNPVTLAPYRTFREVLQPASPFVLRVQGGGGHALPQVGLFEADGGAWRLVAVDRVRDWLREAVPESVAIIA